MTINCRGKLISLESPKVMGILNVTPDSFYDGGRFTEETALLKQVEKMLGEGATFIDLGAYSSRPGAKNISEQEELSRIEPMVKSILDRFPGILLSIDTFRSSIARNCLEAGAAIINDISGGDLDIAMLKTIAEWKAPYIMMHMKGTPQTMTEQTSYTDLITDIRFAFSEKIAKARQLKINDIIIDPGFGFSKTLTQNFKILKNLDLFQVFEVPVLVGLSRKSMIYKTLDITAERALNGTTALHMYALKQGASILRVHDVKEAVECIRLFNEIKEA